MLLFQKLFSLKSETRGKIYRFIKPHKKGAFEYFDIKFTKGKAIYSMCLPKKFGKIVTEKTHINNS